MDGLFSGLEVDRSATREGTGPCGPKMSFQGARGRHPRKAKGHERKGASSTLKPRDLPILIRLEWFFFLGGKQEEHKKIRIK